MQVESKFISIKRKTFLYFVIAVLTLGIATPVLADYLGPDRTTTTSEVDTYDYGVWARDNNKVPYCLDKNGNKADDCIVCEWKRKPGNACGDATYSYKLGAISEVVEKSIDLPPATISSSLQNCNSNNGWCNTLPTLSLNGSEPLAGYNILAVEGSLDGQTFACSDSTCDVPLNEGNNDFTFWALSSYGDSSEMGTLSAKVDTVSPNVGLDVIGSNGTNNWYVSPTTITATGSDSTSGLSNVLLSVNGGAWTVSTTLNDGIYAVDVRAEDNAGNVSTSSTAISVDTTTPSVSLNVNGAMGSNGWYSSTMQVTASASDLTSGIASLEVSADGEVYQAYTSPVSFTDGYHTIRFKATDNAGNQTETSIQEFYVDTTAPAIDLPSSWEVNKTIGYTIQDDGSGLAALRIVIEDEDEKYKKVAWDEEVSGDKFKGEITWNGKFKDGTIAPPGEYLVWIKAKDKAGNERFGLGRVIVPQPTVFSLLQPTITNNQETLLPPQELFDEDELSNASSATPMAPQTSFGGSTTDPKETTQNSLSLVAGTASASTATNSNILWGATAAALIGWATATALEEKKKRKEQEQAQISEGSLQREKAKTRANRDDEPPLTRQEKELAKQRKELQKIWDANGAAIYEANREYKAKHGKEMDVASRNKAIKDATMNGVFHVGTYASNLEAEKTRQDAQNERMADKMTRFEKVEEVRWQASQKAAEEKKAQDLQDGLAAYYAAMRQGEKESQLKAEKEKPWWQKVWDTSKTFVQEKIVEPAQRAWNQYVYRPIVQPVVHWWKEEIPVWAKETGLSLIPIVGDGWGVIRQAIHFFKKEPVDKVDVGLSIVGLIFDIPWPQEGLIGGDVAIAVLKGLNAAIPSGPARDVMAQLIKDGLKNPDDLARIAKTGEALLKNDRLLQVLIENPKALEAVVRYGPEAVDVLGKYGDDAVEIVGKYSEAGINFLLKNELTPDEVSKLAILPNEAAKLSDDVASKIDDDYKNNPLRLEYENKVTGLKDQLQEILQKNDGIVTETDAKALSEIRRNLGIEYKDMTPGPLRDYIYEMNITRYGDPLGPTWDYLMDTYRGNYRKIAEATTRPNKDINEFLSGFDEWINQKDVEYLLEAELKILRGE